jgi:uncharacterized protein with GYD domain
MQRYLIRGSYTSEGAKRLLDEGGSARREAAARLMESVGGKLEAFYFAFGENDLVAIVEAPSNVDASAAALAVAASGSLHVETTVLLTPEEIDEVAGKSTDYTPPGG